MGRKLKFAAAAIIAVATVIYLNNTSLLTPHRDGRPVLLAHRGIAQRFDERDLKNDTCTAARMLPSTHDYLENTLRSMRASFEAGTDVVELDVHPTTDGEFAVFHDWTVDCRTDGHGVTREQSMAKLKMLDIGYGYTADRGKTFPFRGKGIGLMPTLAEVFAAFPDKQLLINVKSRDASEGEKLAAVLSALPAGQRRRVMVYGGDEPIESIRRLTPDVRHDFACGDPELSDRLYRLRLDGSGPGRLPQRDGAGADQRRTVAMGLARSFPRSDDRRQ